MPINKRWLDVYFVQMHKLADDVVSVLKLKKFDYRVHLISNRYVMHECDSLFEISYI